MRIDIHVHATRISGPTRPNGSRYPTPDELLSMMNENGIDAAVLMCTVNPEQRFCFVIPEEVLDVCAEAPERLVPFTSFDPRMLTNSPDADFSDLLAHYIDAGCKGVGEYFPNIPFDDPLNLNLFKQVEEAGLPLTFHIAPKIGGCYGCFDEVGLPRLEKVLQACPDLVLLGHSQPFWAEIGDDATEANRNTYPSGPVRPGRLVELMREYPNLYGDLSAGSGCNAVRRDPEFGLRFMEEFQDRLCFGTDIANVPQQLPLVECFRDIEEKGLLSEEAFEKITWKNAARLLNLDPKPAAPQQTNGAP